LEQGKSFEIKLPTRTSEGVPVFYQPWPGDVCFISQEPPFPWFQPKVEWITVIEFKKPGTCSLTSHNATLYRSTIKDFVFKKEIKVVSKLERDKEISDAKAAVELKAKQEAEAKAAAELKAKQDAEVKAAAELKAKQDAEAKAAAIAAANKKTTITCVKGKLTKKVTAVKPKCPSGYKKK
jgi:hypothetical protein